MPSANLTLSEGLELILVDLERIAKAVEPDPQWRVETCDTCGWLQEGRLSYSCRRHPWATVLNLENVNELWAGHVGRADPACPAWIRRAPYDT